MNADLDKSKVISFDKFRSLSSEYQFVDVVIAVISQQQKVLLSYREPAKTQGGHWELPGGKRDFNENHEATIKREIQEELTILVKKCHYLTTIYYLYDAQTPVSLAVWVIDEYGGKVTALENQLIQWVDFTEVQNLPITRPNRCALKAFFLEAGKEISDECQ